MSGPDHLPCPPVGKRGWPWIEGSPETAQLGPNWPSIGIVTPSYQQGRFLEATLRSVLLQGYPGLKYVVMDGGSKDESPAILARYAPHLAHWQSAPDRGQSDAIDRGIRKLDTDVVGWLNSDDLLLPGALARVARHFAEHRDCQWLCGAGVFAYGDELDRSWVKVPSARSTADLLLYGRDQWLPQPSVFFRRSLYDQVGGVDHSLHYAMDLDLWLRMSRVTPPQLIAEPLSVLRQHDDAKTIRDNERALREISGVIARHGRAASRLQRARALVAMRQRAARSACLAGLQAHHEGDRDASRAAWQRAMSVYPLAFADWSGLKLWTRLLLPYAVRRRIFARP